MSCLQLTRGFSKASVDTVTYVDYLCLRLSRVARGDFIVPVISFVRRQTNEPILMQIGISGSQGIGMKQSTSKVGRHRAAKSMALGTSHSLCSGDVVTVLILYV